MPQDQNTLLLERGVEAVLPNREGLAKLLNQKRIRLYLGIDPTGNQLHLGHAVVLRKLQQFAEAGHEVILLIGNGTVKIGDPTGKDKTRPLLTDEEIESHFSTWKQQAEKILDFSRVTLRKNGEWFDAMSFGDLVRLFSQMTVQQLLERDMFQERLAAGLPIHAHELLYPILQGYDSVMLDVDLEIGGNDQLFNMMAGRMLMERIQGKEKYVLTVPLLVGSDGRKMGKSLGNYIALTESPENMFGKVMSIVDEVIPQYFRLLTDVAEEEIGEIEAKMQSGSLNPMLAKKKLAMEIVTLLHSAEAAEKAEAFFASTVQQREIPEEMQEVEVQEQETLLDLLVRLQVSASRSQARRLVEQGAVELDGNKVMDPLQVIFVSRPAILKAGKRTYFRLLPK